MPSPLSGVTQVATRLASTARNLVEVARLGGLETGEQPAPFEVVARSPIYRLRHYLPDPAPQTTGSDSTVPDTTGPPTAGPDTNGPDTSGPAAGVPPLLLIPPLMLTAEIWDVSPQASAVRTLLAAGLDPWVTDFGSPEHEQGGLERTLEDHVLAISAAIDEVRAATGRDPVLAGYSQGGMFCYQVAAYRRSSGISGLVTFGSPVDLRGAMPLGIPENVGVQVAQLVTGAVFRDRGVPSWMTRSAFRMLDPIGSARQQIEFLLQLHDRKSLLPREGQRRYLMGEGWVAWPGPALADFVEQFLRHRRMLEGGLVIDGRPVTLADIRLPVLYFVGETDDIAPPASVRALGRAAPRAELYEATVRAGHFGLVVGRAAAGRSWPTVVEWVRWLGGAGKLPDAVTKVDAVEDDERPVSPVTFALDAVAESTALVTARAARAVSTVGGFAGSAAVELPRLSRLANTRATTRISLALLLDETARRHPDNHVFLFGDHAYTARQVKERVDEVARGLIARGVRPGNRIGVLMHTRPTAVAVVAALNRVGAVAAILRPDADPVEEAALARLDRLIVDPEHEDAAAGIDVPVHVFLLEPGSPHFEGGVEVPDVGAAFVRNPGRANEPAFVLFTGRPGSAEPMEITNGRWALSALGAASAAALRAEDTIYSLNPLHHPSGLLTGVGGAVAAGARLAMADGSTPFWDEVRRYGVTVVSYTWAQLRAVADGPQTRAELHNAVRLFLGSGMPVGVWRRLQRRLPNASVLEFFVSPAGGALLANVRGVKQGSVGRPMPGSTPVELARYDLAADAIEEGPDGAAIVCRPGEIGILLVRTPDGELYDVFGRRETWSNSGAFFTRDHDGDYWYLGSLATAIRTPGGLVLPQLVTRALEQHPAVDLAMTYAGPDGAPTAAVSLLPDATLDPADVEAALAELAPSQRPARVTRAPAVPLNQWGRPQPPPSGGDTIWENTA